MTQSEFIKQYCKASKVSEKKLNDLGAFVMPCNCKETGCKSWSMIRGRDALKAHLELYF